MEDEIGKNLGLGKLSPWLSWPGFFGCCHAPRGEAVGATFPHGQIWTRELFSDAEIKAVAGLLGWFSFFGGGGVLGVFLGPNRCRHLGYPRKVPCGKGGGKREAG